MISDAWWLGSDISSDPAKQGEASFSRLTAKLKTRQPGKGHTRHCRVYRSVRMPARGGKGSSAVRCASASRHSVPVGAIISNFDYGVSVAENSEQFEISAREIEAIVSFAQSHRVAGFLFDRNVRPAVAVCCPAIQPTRSPTCSSLALLVLGSNIWPVVREYATAIKARADIRTPGSFAFLKCRCRRRCGGDVQRVYGVKSRRQVTTTRA